MAQKRPVVVWGEGKEAVRPVYVIDLVNIMIDDIIESTNVSNSSRELRGLSPLNIYFIDWSDPPLTMNSFIKHIQVNLFFVDSNF